MKFLFVHFDRYDTEDSTYKFVTAKDIDTAIMMYCTDKDGFDEEQFEFIKEMIVFDGKRMWTVSGEEDDLLIFNVG